MKKLFVPAITWLAYIFATLQFIRFYIVSTSAYLDMDRYLNGRERLPFQERILPVFLMWPINHSSFLVRHLSHASRGWDSASASTPETLAFYLLSLVSYSIAGLLVVQLYHAVSPGGRLSALVYPVFMALTLWTYVVHIDADFSFPYDMPSLAFFAGGLLAIYKRKFFALTLIMLVGTMNRETTLFLIGIYVLDAATRQTTVTFAHSNAEVSSNHRFDFAQVSWIRVAVLFVIWFAVKVAIFRRFEGNDHSEDYIRLGENLHRLTPRLWPVLFNICGYALPFVVILRNRLRPVRFANYLYILPLWLAVMFYTGVILESRIYGELCTFTAVAVVLLIEDHVTSVLHINRLEPVRRRAA